MFATSNEFPLNEARLLRPDIDANVSLEADRFSLRERSDTGMAEDEEPELPAQQTAPIISNAEVDRS
jgi:hypothetical protein